MLFIYSCNIIRLFTKILLEVYQLGCHQHLQIFHYLDTISCSAAPRMNTTIDKSTPPGISIVSFYVPHYISRASTRSSLYIISYRGTRHPTNGHQATHRADT